MPYQLDKLRQLLQQISPEYLSFMVYDAALFRPLYQRLTPGTPLAHLADWLLAESHYHAPLLQLIKRHYPDLYRRYAPYLQNPFHHGSGYLHEASAFYGRGQLLREVKSILQQYQNVAILSEPRLGSSSFLYHLVATKAQWLPASTLLAYIDLYGVMDDENFFTTVAAKLGFHDVTHYRAFQLAVSGREVILLLDEVEELADSMFSPKLQKILRAFSQEQHHAIGLVAKRPLAQLFPARDNIISPFHNVFGVQKTLSPFSDHEARQFLRHRLQDDDPTTFSPAEIEQIIQASLGLPSELQRLAYQLFEEKNQDQDY